MMTMGEANKAHRDMMRGLKAEHDSGSLSDSDYQRMKKRAVELHRDDIRAIKANKKSRAINISPRMKRLPR